MSSLESVFNEYINSLPTKIARYQSKRTLNKKSKLFGKDADVKALVYHLLLSKGNHLFYVRTKDKKLEYFIGTTRNKILDLNVTIAQFAKYLLDNGYAHEGNKYLDFKKHSNARTIEADNWFEHVRNLEISEVLISKDNFSKFSELFDYINDVIKGSNDMVVHCAYNRVSKKLDIFTEDDFKNLSDKEYVKLNNLTTMLHDLFKGKSIQIQDRDSILESIDSEFFYRINMLANQI